MNVPKASRRTAWLWSIQWSIHMREIQCTGRGVVRRLGLAAAAMLALSAAPGQRAQALSLISPTAVPIAKYNSGGRTTEVVGRGGGGGFHGGGSFHGGGGGFRGGGFRGGGAAFHSRGFRGGGAAFHGGGFRTGGAVFRASGFRGGHVFRGGGFRGHRFAFRHHFHRRFFYGSYYPYYYPYPYSHRYCRTVWTYYGPRRICRYRPWHRRWYW
jgi:hypothetical protein